MVVHIDLLDLIGWGVIIFVFFIAFVCLCWQEHKKNKKVKKDD